MAMQGATGSRNAQINADVAPEAQATPDSAAHFVVCIASNGDGSYSVYPKDSDMDPNAEQSQSASSIDEALQIAGQLLQAEEGEGDEMSGGTDEPMPADQAQSYWNQLAAKRDATRMRP